MNGVVEFDNPDCEFWREYGIHADYIGDGFPTCCAFDRCDHCGQVVCTHNPLRKMGRPPLPGDFMHVAGNFSGVAYAREAMGIEWMVRDELRESIPPAFSEHLGRQLMAHIRRRPTQLELFEVAA